MTKVAVYAERYFPPVGHASVTAQADQEHQATWFPLHLLLDQLGRCSRCKNPAAYVFTDSQACIPVCDGCVCDFAALTSEGHDGCPRCHIRWCAPPADLTPEFLAQVLAGGA